MLSPTPPNSQPQPLPAADRPAPATLAPRRNPWLTALIVGLLLLGGFFGWRWWRGSQAAQQGAPAAGQAQAIPVTIEPVQTGTVQASSEFVGNLESRRSVELRPEISGRVSRIFVQPGDRVAVGQPIVQLQQDEQAAQRAQRQAELRSAEQAITAAQAALANARSELAAVRAEREAAAAEQRLSAAELERRRELFAQGAIPAEQIDIYQRDLDTAIANLTAADQRVQASGAGVRQAEVALSQANESANAAEAQLAASEAQLGNATVTAPFAGTVGNVPVKLGDFVSAGDLLTSVTQNDVLELEIAVPIERAPELETGQRVVVSDARGNPLEVGRLSFTAPQVDSAAQSVLAKASFENPDGRLLSGQFVRARLIWSETSGVLIPAAAVSRLGGQTFVFVAERAESAPAAGAPAAPASPAGQPPLIARQRLVTLGALQGNRYQVLEGLQPGEQLVTSGILNVSDGAPIAPQAPTTPPSPPGEDQQQG